MNTTGKANVGLLISFTPGFTRRARSLPPR
eukprot:SAG11_NODE_24376_length_373_cov_0.865455_1_plen_29_part_01